MSAASDTALLQKYSKLRQTLPRQPKDSKDGGENDDDGSVGSTGTLTRGGIRGSLQPTGTPRKDISITNLEQPIEGPLNLGTAGSRRTVYLVDENAAKMAADSQNATTPGTPTPTNETVGGGPENNQPSTFLMYNRISTMIGGDLDTTIASGGQPQTNGSNGDKSSTNGDRKKNGKGKESAVWYEYGCV